MHCLNTLNDDLIYNHICKGYSSSKHLILLLKYSTQMSDYLKYFSTFYKIYLCSIIFGSCLTCHFPSDYPWWITESHVTIFLDEFTNFLSHIWGKPEDRPLNNDYFFPLVKYFISPFSSSTVFWRTQSVAKIPNIT